MMRAVSSISDVVGTRTALSQTSKCAFLVRGAQENVNILRIPLSYPLPAKWEGNNYLRYFHRPKLTAIKIVAAVTTVHGFRKHEFTRSATFILLQCETGSLQSQAENVNSTQLSKNKWGRGEPCPLLALRCLRTSR